MSKNNSAFKDYIEDCLSKAGEVSIRSMMGDYLVYYKGKLIGDIGDNVFLVIKTPTSDSLLQNAKLAYPYQESKTLMRVVENPEDTELMMKLLEGLFKDLPNKK